GGGIGYTAAMPRFYFHVYDDIVALDDEGVELPDLETVRREALKGARELACENLRNGKLNLDHRIEVVDEDQRLVLNLPFRSALEIEG
ncbi:MAG TPA: hypothetical protein VGR19_10100, partial [Allosphingosinicella sp.]|nr:hypothetical protein [Allosphingosinicella sp.]